MKDISKDFKKSGIYCIINTINGKKYIGSSINIQDRLQKHRYELRKQKHGNRKLQNSWNKYSEEIFDFYILEFCNKELLLEREQYFIDTLNPEYNITRLVERNIPSPESSKLQSETRIKKIASGEIKLTEKEIYQYNLNGDFIKKYDGIKKACKEIGIHQSTICRFLNGTNRKAGNFLWSLEYKDKLEPYIKFKTDNGKMNKAIKIVDSQTNEIVYRFNSLKDCAKYFNTHRPSISHAIKIKQHFKRKYYILYDI